MSLVLEGKAVVSLEDGKYEGAITKVEERKEPYHYVDVYIETKSNSDNVELKYGAPAKLSPNTKLGRLVKTLTGQNINPGEQYDLEKLFVGKRVTFMVNNEETENGTFARIVDDSVKPVAEGDSSPSPSGERKRLARELANKGLNTDFKDYARRG